jgi:hypothetical protein
MLFKLTAGRLAPAHPPLAHSNFASRVDGKFAYARELQMLSEMKMKIKIKTVSEMGDRRWEAVRLRLRLAPSDLPPPIHFTASRGFGLPLTRGDPRLRKETPPG